MNDEKVLFYDRFSDRYFKGDLKSVVRTVNEFSKDGHTFNQLYEKFGLETSPFYDYAIFPNLEILVAFREGTDIIVYIIQ